MRDIDLIWQGFWDARDGDIMANLGAYEELAAVTGKPIDLFLTAWNGAVHHRHRQQQGRA